MINLWYEENYWSYTNGRKCGPQKVVENTIESLEKQEIPFAINEEKYQYNFLMQYQNEICFKKHENLEHSSCIIGPQFWPFDTYGKFLIENPQYYKKLIAPSEWVRNKLIDKCGVLYNKVSIWPVGIKVPSIKYDNLFDCLIYYKGRDEKDFQTAVEFIEGKKLTYKCLKYGQYTSQDFKNIVPRVKFCFIVDNTESQGIAINEMMAYNKPLFVWDVSKWNYMGEKYSVPATSVPYWNEYCGKKFYNSFEMNDSFDEFYDKLDFYEPKKIIDEHLSYSQSIKKLIEIFQD